VDGQKIGAHTDGIVTSKADLDEMIIIADFLAERCPNCI